MRPFLVGTLLVALGCRSSNDLPPVNLEASGGAGVGTAQGGAVGSQGGAADGAAGVGQGGGTVDMGVPAGAGGAGGQGGTVAPDAKPPTATGGAGGSLGDAAGAGGRAGGPGDAGNPLDAPLDQPAAVVDAASEVSPTPMDVAPPPMDLGVDRAAGSFDFFQVGTIHRIEVTVDPVQWQQFMQEHAIPEAPALWRQADIKIDGVALSKVGFKTFGFGSRLYAPNKPNLHLDINKYVAGQNLHGFSRMRIKNNGQDPSGLRQAITYEAMRAAGVGAPRSTFAQLFVNNEPYGFYSVEESFTTGFVLERTGNDNGAAYEAGDCDGFVPAGGCATIGDYYSRSFNPQAGTGEDLIALCNVMQGPAEQFVAAVTPLIELDQWIMSVAADTALAGDYDGFSTNANNFRMYHDTATNKLRLYIFGPDVTFDADYLPIPDPLKPVPGMDCQMRNPAYRDIFLEKLVGTPAGLARYRQAVQQLRAGPMSPATIKARVDAMWALVGALVKADPRRTTDHDPEQSKELIKTYIDARITQLVTAGL
jgi:hypothetical protein